MQNLIELFQLLHLLQLLHFYCNKNSIMQMLDIEGSRSQQGSGNFKIKKLHILAQQLLKKVTELNESTMRHPPHPF